MFQSIFFLMLGSAGLYYGSEWLIDSAKSIAKKFNVSDLVIGLTIVSIGTSFPELVVGIISSLNGYSDFIIGNVLGSNVANIGLALAIPAIFIVITIKFSDLFPSLIYNLIACILLISIIGDNVISRNDSYSLISFFILYVIFTFYRGKIKDSNQEKTDIIDNSSIFVLFGKFLIGCLILFFGSEIFVNRGAAPLVSLLGFSEKAVGMTIVAIGTSLPELFVTFLALIRKEANISIGNIIGSNVFNILFVLGVIAYINPINISNVSFEIYFGLALLMLLGIATFFQGKVNRNLGLVLLSLYLIFVFLQFS
jgi:cation:H+ antiporter